MQIPAGTRLGSFEVLALLGEGGMGEVYRARDERLGREVALKILAADFLAAPEYLRRFIGEARTASSLNHRNIVTIFEVGRAGDRPFLAMELVDGPTLRQLAGKGLLPLRKVLDVVVQVAEGLSAAHEASLVHRDLKPENLMVARDGTVKILDFGLAKPFGAAASGELAAGLAKTSTGVVVGTASYMSPEQALGHSVDFRSDQFCLGLILYELLTGKKAFERSSAVQTLTAIIEEEPEPIERLNPRTPGPLAWIVERCLAKDPEERYASTRDLARELMQVREHLGRLTAGIPRPTGAVAPQGSETIRTTAAVAARGDAPFSHETIAVSPRSSASRVSVALPAAAPAATAAPASPLRSVLRVASAVLGAVAVIAAGAALGWWLRDRMAEPSHLWDGQLVLGSDTPVLAARLSPDGQTLAFVTPVGGTAQVAVMRPASGDWTLLTRRPDGGSVYRVAWSADGSRLYFDRVSDVPHGVFSVPAVGGEERLVLEGAQNPEALHDDSLLVVKTSAAGTFRIHRFEPATGKVTPVGPEILAESLGVPLRAAPDGKEALFWGRLAGESAAGKPRQLWLLDLATGSVRPVAPGLPVAPPFSFSADGRTFLATLPVGDIHRIVTLSRDGSDAKELLTLTTRPSLLAQGPGRSTYVGVSESPTDVFRFAAAGGVPERLGSARGAVGSPGLLDDGRLVLPGLVAGRRRLLLRSPSGEARPFVDGAEQTSPPVATLAGGRIVFLSGPAGAPPGLVLASVRDGRILRRLPGTQDAVPQELAASPDGRSVYYPSRGELWAIDVDGEAPPRKVTHGHGVAVFPGGEELLVQRNGADGVGLFRVPVTGAYAVSLPLQGELRLAPAPISGRAVAPDGRIVVTVASRDAWRWRPALLDPATSALQVIPVEFDGDIRSVGWAPDGSLVGLGVGLHTELWRFRDLR
jgi:hypothetical protein